MVDITLLLLVRWTLTHASLQVPLPNWIVLIMQRQKVNINHQDGPSSPEPVDVLRAHGHLRTAFCLSRVEMWRGRVQRVAISVCRLVATVRCLPMLNAGFPVSTSPSSNPACLSQAPGFRTRPSRLRPRLLTPHCIQTYEPKGPIQVRDWIAPALAVFRTVDGCATTSAAAA